MRKKNRLSKKVRLARAVRAWKADMEKNVSGYLDDELRLFIQWWMSTH